MKALIVSWAQCTLLKVNIQSYALLSVVTFWLLNCWKNPVWFQRKAAIESWLDLKEDFHSLEAHSVSRCSMSDKETKALKYTLTGIPDALRSWRIKEKGKKKKKSDHPPTLPWGQWCKPRHPHLGFSTFGAHSQGGDCPTNAGVRPTISQILCCTASSVQWLNLPPCRAALRGTHWHPSLSLTGRVGLRTPRRWTADSNRQLLCASPLHLYTSNSPLVYTF